MARAAMKREELKARLDDPTLIILDVRSADEYEGAGGYGCCARQGHIPGARNVPLQEMFAAPGVALSPEEVRELIGAPKGSEVVAYCHSGSRSEMATHVLRLAGYEATNYPGSWHE